jgi:hypothetical protein
MKIAAACSACLLLISCAAPNTPPAAPGPGASGATRSDAVVRRPIPESIVAAPPGSPPRAEVPLIIVPPDTLYVCVTENGKERKQVAIEFAPKVHDVCSRHPEMGPCQYEREACRRGGGRVFAAGGEEITLATEAAYDRKVMRVRFRAN